MPGEAAHVRALTYAGSQGRQHTFEFKYALVLKGGGTKIELQHEPGEAAQVIALTCALTCAGRNGGST